MLEGADVGSGAAAGADAGWRVGVVEGAWLVPNAVAGVGVDPDSRSEVGKENDRSLDPGERA
jgi:hypothetical protein